MSGAARQLSLFKSRRQRGVRPPLPIERKTHIALADALRVGCRADWLWNHFPSGEYRREETGALLKRMGHKPGWWDFILISPQGIHHWLELKRGKAPLSDEQRAFGYALEDRDVPHAVARSFDEAMAQLTSWGALRLTVAA